jgi:hypothetical protein
MHPMRHLMTLCEARPFVKDDEGNIRTFFHRSDADFDRFKRTNVKDKPKWRLTGGGGFYFSTNKAQEFYGKNEYRVALRASNPYINMRLDTTKLSRSSIQRLQAQGYDSIDSPNYGEFIVFKPDQIQIISKNGRPVLNGDIT